MNLYFDVILVRSRAYSRVLANDFFLNMEDQKALLYVLAFYN